MSLQLAPSVILVCLVLTESIKSSALVYLFNKVMHPRVLDRDGVIVRDDIVTEYDRQKIKQLVFKILR